MLLVELAAAIDPVTNERAIVLARRIQEQQRPGVTDVAAGYSTVGIHYDPLHTNLVELERAIETECAAIVTLDEPVSRPPIEIPVVYGGTGGPDLDAVAEFAGCSPEEVIVRHSGAIYRVYMLGFVPGFAYMGRVDPSIAAPRHRVPRERVPCGSVGIAGMQTGVYPVDSPGGWQLIGQTTTVMFDAERERPSLLAAGDLVRFVPVVR